MQRPDFFLYAITVNSHLAIMADSATSKEYFRPPPLTTEQSKFAYFRI